MTKADQTGERRANRDRDVVQWMRCSVAPSMHSWRRGHGVSSTEQGAHAARSGRARSVRSVLCPRWQCSVFRAAVAAAKTVASVTMTASEEDPINT